MGGSSSRMRSPAGPREDKRGQAQRRECGCGSGSRTAAAAPEAAGGRFCSFRRALRTEGEASGKTIRHSALALLGAGGRKRLAHLACFDWLKFSTSLLIGGWSSQISLSVWCSKTWAGNLGSGRGVTLTCEAPQAGLQSNPLFLSLQPQRMHYLGTRGSGVSSSMKRVCSGTSDCRGG